jgi:hypothetical protein
MEVQQRQRPLQIRRRAVGFSFEGVFRQHMVVKGQNRDTAWYSILDSEWPAIGVRAWLSDANQTPTGQVKGLVECRR